MKTNGLGALIGYRIEQSERGPVIFSEWYTQNLTRVTVRDYIESGLIWFIPENMIGAEEINHYIYSAFTYHRPVKVI